MATTEQILVHSAPLMNRATTMGQDGAMDNASGSPIVEFALPEPLLGRGNVRSLRELRYVKDLLLYEEHIVMSRYEIQILSAF